MFSDSLGALGLAFCVSLPFSFFVMLTRTQVLPLRSRDSDKNMILKQMRLIHKVPFSAQETESFRHLIFDSLTHGLKYLLDSLPGMTPGCRRATQTSTPDGVYTGVAGECGEQARRKARATWMRVFKGKASGCVWSLL